MPTFTCTWTFCGTEQIFITMSLFKKCHAQPIFMDLSEVRGELSYYFTVSAILSELNVPTLSSSNLTGFSHKPILFFCLILINTFTLLHTCIYRVPVLS